MDLVGPRLHLKAGRSAATPAVFGLAIGGLQLELLNGIRRDLKGSHIALEFI